MRTYFNGIFHDALKQLTGETDFTKHILGYNTINSKNKICDAIIKFDDVFDTDKENEVINKLIHVEDNNNDYDRSIIIQPKWDTFNIPNIAETYPTSPSMNIPIHHERRETTIGLIDNDDSTQKLAICIQFTDKLDYSQNIAHCAEFIKLVGDSHFDTYFDDETMTLKIFVQGKRVSSTINRDKMYTFAIYNDYSVKESYSMGFINQDDTKIAINIFNSEYMSDIDGDEYDFGVNIPHIRKLTTELANVDRPPELDDNSSRLSEKEIERIQKLYDTKVALTNAYRIFIENDFDEFSPYSCIIKDCIEELYIAGKNTNLENIGNIGTIVIDPYEMFSHIINGENKIFATIVFNFLSETRFEDISRFIMGINWNNDISDEFLLKIYDFITKHKLHDQCDSPKFCKISTAFKDITDYLIENQDTLIELSEDDFISNLTQKFGHSFDIEAIVSDACDIAKDHSMLLDLDDVENKKFMMCIDIILCILKLSAIDGLLKPDNLIDFDLVLKCAKLNDNSH